jgi:hypothetical protein
MPPVLVELLRDHLKRHNIGPGLSHRTRQPAQ